MGAMRTLGQVLQARANESPDKVAFVYLRDGDSDEQLLTYGELNRRVSALGRHLAESVGKGQRAVLLYPPGVEYLVALYACLAAGIVPVPAYPPDPTRLARTLPRLQAIVEDSKAAVVLTTSMFDLAKEMLFEIAPGLREHTWQATDVELEHKPWSATPLGEDDLVLLQYTSGSTGSPKGVMITNRSLMANLQAIVTTAFEYTPSTVVVSWLPHYHDMGLIGGIFSPVYAGCKGVLLSPLDFLQKPMRWLHALSKYRGTVTAAPNFAFDLCVRRVEPEEPATLDLSSVRICLNAAEPVLASTIDRFVETFGPAGFQASMIRPSYGLAEATLIVTTGRIGTPQVVTRPKATPPRVSCGRAVDQKVLIVDPETRAPCADGREGEIWVSGANVGKGYWNKPEDTEETFSARLSSGDGPYLRTGDIGFLTGEDLFVTGRLKDMIIVRGRNFYPSDLEKTAEACHVALRPGCGAAFSIDGEDGESVVVVYEADARREANLDAVMALVRSEIAATHELDVSAIALVAPKSIPKTSSGKIMRRATKDAYLGGGLEVIAEWRKTTALTPHGGDSLRAWMAEWCAQNLGAQEVDLHEPLSSYGLTSVGAVELSAQLGQRLGRTVQATIFLDYPSIDALSSYLEGSQDG